MSLLVFIYLARALSPADFGIVALAAVFVDLLALASCFGQMELVQQRPAPNRDAASTSFWLVQSFGIVATVTLVLAAPWIAQLMGIAALETYLLLLSPAILVTTLGHVHEGLLRRQMKFGALAIRNIAATASSGGAAIAAVLADIPEFALVVQKLVFALAMTVTLWLALPWRPRLRASFATARSQLRAGFHILAANASIQLNTRIVDFIVGLTLGTYWLGQLKIAWRIFDFVSQISIAPISSVSLSLFARAASTAERLAKSFVETVKVMAVVACPIFFGLAVLALRSHRVRSRGEVGRCDQSHPVARLAPTCGDHEFALRPTHDRDGENRRGLRIRDSCTMF